MGHNKIHCDAQPVLGFFTWKKSKFVFSYLGSSSSPEKSSCTCTKWVKNEKKNVRDENAERKCLSAVYRFCDVGSLLPLCRLFLISDMEGAVLGAVLWVGWGGGGQLPRILSGTITGWDWQRKGTHVNSNQDKAMFCVGLGVWAKYSLEKNIFKLDGLLDGF